jgi:dTDP-4-dehydrorhamnose 3,5-epimerase
VIEGVRISQLIRIPDERGTVMRMLRETDDVFEQFGEIYFSSIYPGAIKAWHHHELMVLNYAVPIGNIKLVLFDDRQGSPTRGELNELFIGEMNYSLVTIPRGVWNGFKCIGTSVALIANCTNVVHDKSGMTRKDPLDPMFNYDWALKNR